MMAEKVYLLIAVLPHYRKLTALSNTLFLRKAQTNQKTNRVLVLLKFDRN